MQMKWLSYHQRVIDPKKALAFVFCLVLALSAVAQEAQEGESEEPDTYKEQYEKYQKQAKKTIEYPWFVGGASASRSALKPATPRSRRSSDTASLPSSSSAAA